MGHEINLTFKCASDENDIMTRLSATCTDALVGLGVPGYVVPSPPPISNERQLK